jgi:hypothetical protein
MTSTQLWRIVAMVAQGMVTVMEAVLATARVAALATVV